MKSISGNKPKILVIVGPTASGKTALAIKLAKKFGGEIVSADSRQIYRGMDIGTAKYLPNNNRIKSNLYRIFGNNSRKFVDNSRDICQHLIDIRNPYEDYTVADFKRDAVRAIKNILRRGKLPILVGGTGLYVKAVVENLDIPEVKADPALREKLESELAQKGLGHLFRKLIELDPEAAYIVDQKNPRRVVRALEVAIRTGKPFSAQRKKGRPLFETLEIGINFPEKILRRRIYRRVDGMIKNGLVREVRGLIGKYGPGQRAFDAIGYKEIAAYLDGKISLDQAAEAIKNNTWAYAKRQMTWFKKDKNIKWVGGEKEAAALVKNFLAARRGV